jgi:hypothetical protein
LARASGREEQTVIRFLLLVFALSSTVLAGRALAQSILNVPNNYSQPAAAIAAASTTQVDTVVITSDNQTYEPFTVDKAVVVRKGTGVLGEVIIDATGSNFAAKITHSGGKISGLTLRGGNLYVLDVGPGTVQNCRIEDVSGSLQYDPAVLMPSATGKLHDSRIVRVASARAVEMSAAAELKRCYIDINGTSQHDDPAILVTYPGVTIEADTIDFASGLSHTRFGIEMGVNSGDATVHRNEVDNANKVGQAF